jgi:uncharacterized protein YecT (DUF1311 family)
MRNLPAKAFFVAIAAIALGQATYACGDDPPFSPDQLQVLEKQRDCGAHPGNQVEINDCEEALFKLSEFSVFRTVNDVRDAILKGPDAGETDQERTAMLVAFKAAQRVWCEARDVNCDFDVYHAHGGSMGTMIAATCRKERNLVRIKALGTLAACYRGGCEQPISLYVIELYPNDKR